MHSENAQVHTVDYNALELSIVRLALEIEVSKEEQRGVVRFLVHEGTVTRHKVKHGRLAR